MQTCSSRTMAILAAGLYASLAMLPGCASDEAADASATRTPIGLLSQLAELANARDVDGVLRLLSEDATAQNGKQWLQFANRTAASLTLRAMAAIPQEEYRNLETASGEEFLRKLNDLSPQAFATLFRFYPAGEIEEDGRLLVYAKNDSGKMIYLGMQRQDNAALRLLGEAEARKIFDALRDKLNEKLRNPPPAG